MVKHDVSHLAIFSGKPLFENYISTSNLVRPDFDLFLEYSRTFFDQQSYSNGPLVSQLEQRLAKFHQVEHCVVVSSGFWALVLAIKCLAIPGRKEIVMPSLTYRRMADVAAWAGLVPHFCEVDPNTLAISAETAESVINENTALILGVHPIVNCCDAEGLENLAKAKQIPILFDAVESGYETINGKKVGSFGHAEVFSMHASKLINGFEGGYITTNDAHLSNKLKNMRTFGVGDQDHIEELGTNAKLSEIHAAMTLANLDGLETQIDHNYSIYKTYHQNMDHTLGLRLLTFNESDKCSYKNIVVELEDSWPLSRADTLRILHAERILARAYYSPALHQKEASYPVITEELSLTERLAERFMLLPCGYFVNEHDIVKLIELFRFMKANATEIKERLAI